jgi:outer membrane lipoprotein-sorting protein
MRNTYKKGFVLVSIMMLAFSLVACGNNEITSNVNEEGESVEVNVNDEAGEEVEMAEAEESVEEPMEEEGLLDSTLSGIELLKSFNLLKPDTLRVEAETNSFGMEIYSVTYIDGKKTRFESDMGDFGSSITISLPEEGVVYYFDEGNTQGTKIIGMTEEEVYDSGYIVDDSELFSEITNNPSENMVAKVEMLDGEEVVYIESKETEEDMGEILVKMWYSVKYALPLKYEIIMDDEIIASYQVTAIEKNVKFDSDIFSPPEDVEFMEVDTSAMFDEDMFDEDMFDNLGN